MNLAGPAPVESLPAFLEGGGACARLIAARDWSGTLGPLEGWPASLRTATAILLRSPVPMVMLWGEVGVMIYNDAYSVFAGGRHPELLGSRVREGWPEVVDFNDNVMRVGLAGETLAYRDMELTLYRHGRPEQVFMNLDYSPVPGDDGRPAGVLAVVVETTERVAAERELRASEERLRFLDRLGHRTQSLTDAAEIMAVTARVLGEHLGVAVCAYADMEPDQDGFTIRGDWTASGLASIMGVYSLTSFGEVAVRELRAGRALVTRDTLAELGPAQAAMFLQLGLKATVCMPLVKEGRLTALMAVHAAEPRDWTRDELGLVAETTERSWAHVERVRSEAALRTSEARYRTLFESIESGFCIVEVKLDGPGQSIDYRVVEANPAFYRHTGFTETVLDQWLREAVPALEEHWYETYGRVARTGEPARLEQNSALLGRWFDVHAFRVGQPGESRVAILFNDITARRAVEAERDRARRLLETFAEAVPGVVYAKDREGRLLVGNRGTTELFGRPPEAYLGRTDAEVLGDPEQARALMETDRRIMESGVAEQVEETVSLADGTPAVWFSTKAPLRDGEGRVVGLIGSSIDITARKETEARLAESEERFRNMADHAPVMMWVTDPSGRCTYLNRVWFDFTGQDREAALGHGWLDAIHRDDTAESARIFMEATERREPFRLEYRLRRADGEYRWALDAAAPRFGPAGEFLGFIGSVIDIADRKEAEEELRARTAELDSLLGSAPLGVAFFDRKHRWVRINEELAEVNGYSVEAHLGRRMEELLPVNAGLVGPTLDHIFETGEAVRNVEVTGEVPHAPGVRRHWLVNYYPVKDDEGRVTAVGTWVVDITERKEAEARARDSEARLRAVFEAVPVGLVFADAEANITGGNARVGEILAHPILPSRGVEEYDQWVSFHPDGRQVEGHEYPLARALAGEERPELEVHYQRGDGRRIWVRFIGAAVRDGEGQISGGVVASLDVDRERRAEAELRLLNETLERRVEEAIARREQAEEALRQSQKMEAVGQLTGGIAHDFNNMLAAVIGSLDLLGRRIGEEDARARRYVDGAMEGARRAASLTQRLLAFSRQQPLRPEPVDVDRLVLGMSDLLSRSLGAGVRIETVLATDLWKTHADPNQLENAILNLAVNARDAMPEGGRLTIGAENARFGSPDALDDTGVPPGQYVRIVVTDTGSGMTPEVIARAFDPFFTTKPVGQGTGLGLSQVYGFVRQSGGHVTIHSEPGQGTTVSLYLPRLLSAKSEEAVAEAPRELPRGEAQEVVLVVEDEAVVRQFTVDALAELGYRVLEADGAAAALRLLDGHPEVALLFTDVVMPDTNGRRLADEALRRRPGLRVLFTTGYTRDAVVHDGVLEPGVHLIGKPFSVEELAAKLREVLEEGARG
jgi:PAS domain S-box-containing protein